MKLASFATNNSLPESQVRDYFALLKPRVMSLVIFSGIAGIVLAPGAIHPLIAIIATLCIALGSGAAGAINMWYDRDIDCIMTRTKSRPIPSGKILPEDALEFGVALAALSVFLMAFAVNYMAASLLLAAILFYVFIYTMWLKRLTPQNIVIGGAAGAFPPMIGWAAVTSSIAIESIVLFLLIFIWTPPHFWALALYKSDDYQKAGVPMLPVVRGLASTRQHILFYSTLLVLFSLVPFLIGMSGLVYFTISLLLGLVFLYYAWRIYHDQNNKYAPILFGFSIVYLFAIFCALMIDKGIS